MNEVQWVQSLLPAIESELAKRDERLSVDAGKNLPYAWEIRQYRDGSPPDYSTMDYETDLLVIDRVTGSDWIPRVVVEAKLGSITTHDAITYSQKSATHKQVHPYLRYGVLLGNRRHYPLPGRLFRHGAHFDFMISFEGEKPINQELNALVDILIAEVGASRSLEEIIINSRRRNRERFTVLHKPLLPK